jgi:cyclohexadienyl dehydratase
MIVRRLAALAAALLVSFAAHAQETTSPSRLDEIIKRGTLRVGMTGDYKPFTYLDKATQKFSGFDVDMAEALGKALGVKVEYVQTAWPKLTKDFEADQFDVAMGGVSITFDRQKKGLFSTPIMREGKTPIARCADVAKYQTLADIDKKGTRVIVNPGNADLMMTDASETRYQQKQHQSVLCAVHPDKPFDFSEKAYWLQRDVALKAFVDQWLHVSIEDGSFQKIYGAWFD